MTSRHSLVYQNILWIKIQSIIQYYTPTHSSTAQHSTAQIVTEKCSVDTNVQHKICTITTWVMYGVVNGIGSYASSMAVNSGWYQVQILKFLGLMHWLMWHNSWELNWYTSSTAQHSTAHHKRWQRNVVLIQIYSTKYVQSQHVTQLMRIERIESIQLQQQPIIE